MSKVVYCNITYHCNNACSHCISHNVRRHSQKQITIDDYRLLIDKNGVSSCDYMVISGGEPTLHSSFCDIVQLCYQYTKHIIVYSNGRKLFNLPDNVLNKIERIIVPIYGDASSHNTCVGSNMAYMETMKSIDKIIKLDPEKLDIKILLNDQINTEQLLQSPEWIFIKLNTHFSVSRIITPNEPICSKEIVNRAERMINTLLSLNKIVRFYDFPFCWFSTEFKQFVLACKLTPSTIDSDVVCGIAGMRQNIFRFNKPTDYFQDCFNCKNAIYCTMIMKNYFCPSINNGQIIITNE